MTGGFHSSRATKDEDGSTITGAATVDVKSEDTEARIVNAVVKYFISNRILQVVKKARERGSKMREGLKVLALAFSPTKHYCFYTPLVAQ